MHPLVKIVMDISTNTVLVDILVNILTETQPICWSIYRLIYRVTCWPTYQPAISQYFASIAVNTRSIRWPLNVSGILVDCQWYIDWLSYNTRCFRVFLKASSILETSSMEVLQTLRSIWQCWHPWNSCWKIDFLSFLLWSFRNEQFFWNEQTSVRHHSVTWSDIWVLF